MSSISKSEETSDAVDFARKDLLAKRGEFLFPLPSAIIDRIVPLLEDSRDRPAVILIINVLLTSVPAVATLMATGCTSHGAWAALTIVNYLLFLQRMVLSLHVTEHRKLFKSAWLNTVLPLLCVLWGVPW